MVFLSTPSARRTTDRGQQTRQGSRDFYPRPPRGGRQGGAVEPRRAHRISIHALREEGDLCSEFKQAEQEGISIHALREEGDEIGYPLCYRFSIISIHALREEGDPSRPDSQSHQGISIHALREEGDLPQWSQNSLFIFISIHALREEGDLLHGVHLLCGVYFYPRPPRGGRRLDEVDKYPGASKFLSTPSARRATTTQSSVRWRLPNFYPRPPRGGRQENISQKLTAAKISIHALREEGDCECIVDIDSTTEFLSTPSARRAT